MRNKIRGNLDTGCTVSRRVTFQGLEKNEKLLKKNIYYIPPINNDRSLNRAFWDEKKGRFLQLDQSPTLYGKLAKGKGTDGFHSLYKDFTLLEITRNTNPVDN